MDNAFDLGVPDVSQSFPTQAALLYSLQVFAVAHGYVITKRAGSDASRLRLKCDKGSSYRNRMNRPEGAGHRLNTSSRLIECPFRLGGRQHKDGLWYISLTH